MNLRAWVLAARPPTLLAAVAPVVVGCGLAIGDGVFRWDAGGAALGVGLLLNVAANFANDASDARRGADTPDRIGPRRVVASGLLSARQMWGATAIAVTLAAALGAYLAAISSWWLLGIGAAAIVAMLGYTGGPWPYGYRGLGEVFVFVFFGLVAVVGSRFVHDASLPREAWLLAVPVGFLVTAILVANNVRDLDTDRATGKRTLAVRLGRDPTRALFATLIVGAFILVAAYALSGLVDRLALVAFGAAPLAVRPISIVTTRRDGPGLVTALKATALLHAVFGVLLAVGVAI